MAPSTLLRNTTLVMSAIAAALVQLAVVQSHQPLLPGMVQLAIVLVIAAGLFQRTRSRSGVASLGTGVTLTLALLAAIPFLAEPLSRWIASHGNPPEVQIALALRNLMVGLAALQSNVKAQRLACLASLFIVLFSLMWTVSGVAIGLLVAYTVLAMWWLLGAYWDGLAGKFAANTVRDLPKAPAIGLTLLGVVVLGLLPMLHASHVTTALAGFFPSSGGTGALDPFARSGVGDGDQLVAAQEDAMSFGPIESELFLESEMPSLYDVVDEFYNEPAKNKRRANVRAIPLSPSATQESRRRMATTKQAGREFTLIRQPPPTRKEQRDRSTHALFSVAGRVPLHLKLATFNRWDGHTLSYESPAPALDALTTMIDGSGRNWASLGDSRATDLFPTAERHILRILNLKTKRVPTPPHVSRLHVDQMRDARLFNRAADGGVDYGGDFVPQLTVLHLDSRPVKQQALRHAALHCGDAADSSEQAVPEPIAALARQWTSGVPRGWRQVSAICERLRNDYRHDRGAVPPQDCEDAAVHFLTEAGRGNDASFAASAALLVRSLGYETQVASGFYATPEKFDASSGQTAVTGDDVHFWAEVLTDDGVWLTLEPTPGYEVLYAHVSWGEQVAIAAGSALAWLMQRKWSVLAAIVLLVALCVLRRRVLAICAVLAWRYRWRTSDQRSSILWTFWLIEMRARLSGAPRPSEIPPGRWWEARLAAAPWKGQSPASAFLAAVQWALYADDGACPIAESIVDSSCRSVAQEIGTVLRKKKPSA